MVWTHTLNPVVASLGPLEIRWYGIMYVLIFIITYVYARFRIKKDEEIGLTVDALDWLFVYGVIGMLVGARVFEVLVYDPSFYFANPGQIIAIWKGGLSFHGGLVGILVAGWWYCRSKKISLLRVADMLIVPLAIGQALGRLGNFINGELYGKVTKVAWAVIFPGAEGARHPSQLYEAFYDVVIFSVLFGLRDRKYKPGTLLALFLIMYAVFRSITEFFRVTNYYVGPLTIGQFLNVFVFLGGVWLLWRVNKN